MALGAVLGWFEYRRLVQYTYLNITTRNVWKDSIYSKMAAKEVPVVLLGCGLVGKGFTRLPYAGLLCNPNRY